MLHNDLPAQCKQAKPGYFMKYRNPGKDASRKKMVTPSITSIMQRFVYNCSNRKSLFLFNFCIKIFSKLHNSRIEPLMADGVFWRCFHTFLGLDNAIYLAVNGTVTTLLVFIPYILNCVAKTIKAFTGLERQHFHFGVEYPFKCFKVSHKRVFTVSGRLRGTVH